MDPASNSLAGFSREQLLAEITRRDSGSNDSPSTNTPKRGRKRPSSPIYTAKVDSLAEPVSTGTSSSTANVDSAILERIKKCLARANQPTTVKNEADAAMHFAKLLMDQYNIAKADVLANDTTSPQTQYAGESVVSLRRTDRNEAKTILHFGFVDVLMEAVDLYFNCKSYHTHIESSSTHVITAIQITFYGIAENTVAAAMAYEMLYNVTSQWALSQKGGDKRNSYRLGIADEQVAMAQTEKKAEVDRAAKAKHESFNARVKQDEEDRQAQLDRLKPLQNLFEERESRETGSESNLMSNVDSGNDQRDYLRDDESDDESLGEDDVVEPQFIVGDKMQDIQLTGDLDEEMNLQTVNQASQMQP